MTLRIRLRQQGRTNRPFFRVVVTEGRTRRDGKYIEALGWYNPFGHDEAHELNIVSDRVLHWIEQGAEVSECVGHLLKRAAKDVWAQKVAREEAAKAAVRQKRKARRQGA